MEKPRELAGPTTVASKRLHCFPIGAPRDQLALHRRTGDERAVREPYDTAAVGLRKRAGGVAAQNGGWRLEGESARKTTVSRCEVDRVRQDPAGRRERCTVARRELSR